MKRLLALLLASCGDAMLEGNVHYAKGEDQEAIADYTEAIRLDPDYAVAYNNRGLAYRYLGEYERAIDDCTEAIRLDPDLAIAYNNRGYAYHDLGEYERAIADLESYLQLAPPDDEFRAEAERYIEEMQWQQ